MSNCITRMRKVKLLQKYERAHGIIYYGDDKARQDKLVALLNTDDLEALETFLQSITC